MKKQMYDLYVEHGIKIENHEDRIKQLENKAV